MAIKLSISEELSFFLGHSIREMEDLKQRGCITDRLYRHIAGFGCGQPGGRTLDMKPCGTSVEACSTGVESIGCSV